MPKFLDDGGGLGEALLGFGFNVQYDGNYLGYVPSIEIGEAFMDSSAPFNLYNISDVELDFNEESLLTTLFFDAESGIDLVGVYDGLFYRLFYEIEGADIFTDISITINDDAAQTAPVPESVTILLLGTGLLGLTISK